MEYEENSGNLIVINPVLLIPLLLTANVLQMPIWLTKHESLGHHRYHCLGQSRRTSCWQSRSHLEDHRSRYQSHHLHPHHLCHPWTRVEWFAWLLTIRPESFSMED